MLIVSLSAWAESGCASGALWAQLDGPLDAVAALAEEHRLAAIARASGFGNPSTPPDARAEAALRLAELSARQGRYRRRITGGAERGDEWFSAALRLADHALSRFPQYTRRDQVRLVRADALCGLGRDEEGVALLGALLAEPLDPWLAAEVRLRLGRP